MFKIISITDQNDFVVELLRLPASGPAGQAVAKVADQNIIRRDTLRHCDANERRRDVLCTAHDGDDRNVRRRCYVQRWDAHRIFDSSDTDVHFRNEVECRYGASPNASPSVNLTAIQN